jgi:large subunit ribosomal protein L13
MPIIVNAENLVAGRLSSWVAKKTLEGHDVMVINAEKAVVIGSRKRIIEDFHAKHHRGEQYRGPFYPRMPHLILRRIVRGMLPYTKARGKVAFKRITTYIGVPPGIDLARCVPVEVARVRGEREMVTLGEISSRLGAVWNDVYPSQKVAIKPSETKAKPAIAEKKELSKKEAPKKKETPSKSKEHEGKGQRKHEQVHKEEKKGHSGEAK